VWSSAPEDRFFSYKHYLDGNGELIDRDPDDHREGR